MQKGSSSNGVQKNIQKEKREKKPLFKKKESKTGSYSRHF